MLFNCQAIAATKEKSKQEIVIPMLVITFVRCHSQRHVVTRKKILSQGPVTTHNHYEFMHIKLW